MARFRGTIQGSRGDASRLGTPRSGLTVTADGWDIGCRVEMTAEDGEDRIRVYLTGGSNDRETPTLIWNGVALPAATPED